MKKQLVMGTLAAAMTMGAMAPAMAEGLGASAGVASMYLWRGQDLGDGSAAVWGDINYKVAGAYAGVWASSGDSGAGSEYDLYAGYGMELGGITTIPMVLLLLVMKHSLKIVMSFWGCPSLV